MEIVEVFVTYWTDALSVKNGTTVDVGVFNLSYHRQAGLFLRMEQIADPDISLRDVS